MQARMLVLAWRGTGSIRQSAPTMEQTVRPIPAYQPLCSKLKCGANDRGSTGRPRSTNFIELVAKARQKRLSIYDWPRRCPILDRFRWGGREEIALTSWCTAKFVSRPLCVFGRFPALPPLAAASSSYVVSAQTGDLLNRPSSVCPVAAGERGGQNAQVLVVRFQAGADLPAKRS